MLALPSCKIGVLNRQRLQADRDSRAMEFVKLLQFMKQQAARPTVAGDVVRHNQQGVLIVADLQERRSHHETPAQIERTAGLLPDQGIDGRSAPFLREASCIEE